MRRAGSAGMVYDPAREPGTAARTGMEENELSALAERVESLEKELAKLAEQLQKLDQSPALVHLTRRLRELEFKLAKLERR
jgi:predicted nuclease with TOPRIM domain